MLMLPQQAAHNALAVSLQGGAVVVSILALVGMRLRLGGKLRVPHQALHNACGAAAR